MAGPAADLFRDGRLQWQSYRYMDNPKATYKVPAAANADGWSPQWGILELQFAVEHVGPKHPPLTARFLTQVDGTSQSGANEFVMGFEGAAPFEVPVLRIEAGEMTEN